MLSPRFRLRSMHWRREISFRRQGRRRETCDALRHAVALANDSILYGLITQLWYQSRLESHIESSRGEAPPAHPVRSLFPCLRFRSLDRLDRHDHDPAGTCRANVTDGKRRVQ
jgi:hypothetical protein